LESATFELVLAAVAGLIKALVLWLQEVLAARSAIAVKQELRAKLLNAYEALGTPWLANQESARLSLLATTSLAALDNYFSKYLPQLFYTFLATPILTATIFFLDPASGWAVIFTLPLIPIFMILIGLATKKTQQAQLESLGALSQHLLEVIRGLGMLKIFGREKAQIETIRAMSNTHHKNTMKVLRVSFLSGFALELIGSLSVALIAVSIGLRLVDGAITLGVGLFVLLLAPEAFLPLRMVGANFHASAEGVEASTQILDIIDQAKFSGGAQRASADFAANSLTVITGPSGAGKTTWMRKQLHTLGFERVSYQPQKPMLSIGTVLQNIVGFEGEAEQPALARAIELAGLNDVELEALIGEGSRGVSGGQAQRIAFARTVYRALKVENVNVLLFDEPISAQDAERSKHLVKSLELLSQEGFEVSVISHQKIDSATKTIEFAAANDFAGANV
jgi:ATP-binding cassette subfamily C protein CydD